MDEHFLHDCVEGEPGIKVALWRNPYGGRFECTTRNGGIIADPIDGTLTPPRSAVDERTIGSQVRVGPPIVAAV